MSRNIKMLGKSVPLLPLVLSVMLVFGSGVVIADFLLSRQVGMSMRIIAYHEMMLLDTDQSELVTIPLGEYYRGDAQTLGSFFIINTGDVNIFGSWTVAGVPVGVTITVDVYNGGFLPLAENVICPDPIEPGGSYGEWTWQVNVDVASDAPLGTFEALTLVWSACSTPTG